MTRTQTRYGLGLLLATWGVLLWRGGLMGWQSAWAGLFLGLALAIYGLRLRAGEAAALCFTGLLGLGTLWARVPQAHVNAVLALAAAVVLFALARRDPRWTPERAGLLFLAFATLSAGALVAAGFIIGEGLPVPYEIRGMAPPHIASRWVAPNQNILAAAVLAPGAALAVAARLRGRAWAWIALIFCIVGLVYAGSRAGFLSLGLCLIWVLIRAPERGRAAAWALAVSLATALLAWQAPFSKLRLRVQAMADAQEQDANYFRRKDFWKGALALSRENPWLGKGLESFGNEAWRLDLPTPLEWRNPIARYRLTLEHAHSDWLELGVELGWPLALLALAGALLVFLDRLRRAPDLAAAGVEVFGVAAAFHACLDMTLRTPAILAGLALGAAALYPHRNSEAPRSRALGIGLGLLLIVGGLGVWTARKATKNSSAGIWLDVAACLQPFNAAVQAQRLLDGRPTWPWATWAGRRQWIWVWSQAQHDGRAGREAAALEGLRRCVQLRPYWAPGWLQLGLALQRIGRIEEAEAAVEHSIALEPNFGRARAWRCERWTAQGRFDEARQELRNIHALLTLRTQREEPSEYTLFIQYVDPDWLEKQNRKLGLSTGFHRSS